MFITWMKKFKQNIGYISFLAVLAMLMIVFTLDRNPGHIYIGPSGTTARNVAEGTAIFDGRDFATEELFSGKDSLWGVSVRFLLSGEDVAANDVRTTREITGIKKDFEEAASSNVAENVYVELYACENLIGDWEIALSEIRSGTDTKFVFGEAVTGMEGKELQLFITTGVAENRVIIIENIQVIENRISVNVVKGIMLGIVLLMLGLSVMAAEHLDYPKAFLVLGSIMAVLWLVAMPYGRVPDEQDHFFRIYEISQGNLTSDSRMSGTQGAGSSVMDGEYDFGRLMPGNLDLNAGQHIAVLRDVIDYRSLQLDEENLVWYSFPNMSLYSPISYLPQLIGVILAKMFTDSVLPIIYMGRVLGLAVTIVALYYALKIIPLKKDCLFIVTLLPMLFQEAVSLSADSFINAIAIFYTAYIFSLVGRTAEQKLQKRELLILWLGSILIALCKVVYLPICTLCLMISDEAFGSKKQKYIHTVGAIGIGTVLNFLWISTSDMGSAASSGQISFILENPFVFVKIVVRTLLQFGDEVIAELFGSNMGGLNIPVNELPLWILAVVLIILAVVPKKGGMRVRPGQKLFSAFVWMAVLAMTWGSMYLGYNAVGNNLITGFQGRYFIPMIMLMLISMENKHFEREDFEIRKYIYPLTVCINIYVLFIVLEHVLW